jgi:serine protease Do
MSRWTGLGIGTAAVAAVVLAGGPVRVGAADEAPGKSAEQRRHVDVMRHLGGGGHLGVTLEDGEGPGAVVKDVQPDTPAAKAGLQAGDVIVRYQGERVEGAAALARMVRETPSGRRVESLRDGALEDLDIELPEMPPVPDMPDMSALPPTPPIPPLPRDGEDVNMFRRLLRETGGARKLGIQYQEISGQLAQYFKLGEERGILVSEVDDGGPAAKAGLQAGDVILKFNGNAVTESRGLRELVRKAEAGSEATLTVSREGRTMDLKVKLGGSSPAARRPARTT